MIDIQKGTLTVLKISGKSYIVECSCGNVFKAFESRFKNYTGKGCMKCKSKGINNGRYSHGGYMENRPEYNSWRAMRERCNNPRYHHFHMYGGRGVKVCERWNGINGFASFLEDMGSKPTSKHSIDRVDRDGDYTPDNCVWSTQDEQMSHVITNRRVTINNETKIFSEWCRIYKIRPSVAHNRITQSGMDVVTAITKPVGKLGTNQFSRT